MEHTEIQQCILAAASASFREFGYKKTSLSDVADRAAVSRQSIYLHFENKKKLFQAASEYELSVNVSLASAALNEHSHPEAALVEAFAVWHGQYIARSQRLRKEGQRPPVQFENQTLHKCRAQFIELITARIAAELGDYLPTKAGIAASDIANVLLATSRGIIGVAQNEAQYRNEIGVAIRALLNTPSKS